jgi:bilirubin oxidase
LKLVTDPLAPRPASPVLPFWQIGAEGGFLPAPAELPKLLMAPAERADLMVDFSSMPLGTELYLINEGPDEPFGGGEPNTDFPAADPSTTGQVMKFVVVPMASLDASLPADQLTLPAFTGLGAAEKVRRLSLNEAASAYFDGPAAAHLGTMEGEDEPEPMQWMDAISEKPRFRSTEMWEFHNFTEDAHPIHLHLVQFQVVNRQSFEEESTSPPEAGETGYKDTVIAYPEQITRVKAHFDIRGRYVWHCHIVEHEDNEMMRPYEVG